MNRFIFGSVIAFWASVATLAIAGALSADRKVPAISINELRRHKAAADCWIAVEGKVYDVTPCINGHPTPPDVVTRWCGNIATEAFESKGIARRHSVQAWTSMRQHYVGELTSPVK